MQSQLCLTPQTPEFMFSLGEKTKKERKWLRVTENRLKRLKEAAPGAGTQEPAGLRRGVPGSQSLTVSRAVRPNAHLLLALQLGFRRGPAGHRAERWVGSERGGSFLPLRMGAPGQVPSPPRDRHPRRKKQDAARGSEPGGGLHADAVSPIFWAPVRPRGGHVGGTG